MPPKRQDRAKLLKELAQLCQQQERAHLVKTLAQRTHPGQQVEIVTYGKAKILSPPQDI